MQLQNSFKKEWAHFTRTFRIWGVVLIILGFAVSNPMMYKMVAILMDEMMTEPSMSTASLMTQAPADGSDGGILGGINFEDAMAMYRDAGIMFSVTLSSVVSMGLLVTMLILMSAAGGEQKKRAMIVPMCSGLDYRNYLLPKFIIYPLFTFAVSFVSALIAGGLCNAMFENDKISAAGMFLSALDMSVYMMFVVCVFLSLGLCTSRPGVMVPCIFLGQSLLNTLLAAMDLSRFHPFALLGYIDSLLITTPDFLETEGASFAVAIVLSLVISVLMFFLALGVLKAKKINNQEEIEPEF